LLKVLWNDERIVFQLSQEEEHVQSQAKDPSGEVYAAPTGAASEEVVVPIKKTIAGQQAFADTVIWWGYLAFGVVLLFALLWLLARLLKVGGGSGTDWFAISESRENAPLPKLSKAWERQFQHNQREMAAAEGNLLSTGEELKTIYVSSCFHGDGKTTAAVNLAYSLAEISNKNVLLIDGNSNDPQLHNLFGLDVGPGLTDCYGNPQQLGEILHETAYPRLKLLMHGDNNGPVDHIAKQTQLLSSPELLNRFDYVLIDGDSALGSSRVSMLAKAVDGILLVVACEKTKWEVVQQVKERILQVNGKVIGVILNKRKFYVPSFFYGRK